MEGIKKISIFVLTLLLSVVCSLTLTTAYAATENVIGAVDIDAYKAKITDVITTSALTLSDNTDALTTPTFKLPASLQIIEDEAFEGTAIVVVEIPENVESIGEKAFANIRSLRKVKIPVKTDRIAKSAFVGSDKVTITAAPGSYARVFATENGLPFAPIAVMTASTGNIQVLSASQTHCTRIDIDTTGLDGNGEETHRWRSVDEIHIEKYDQCIAHCIIGRAPPACT